MKIFNYASLFFAALLAASCSSNMEFSKRKYLDGYDGNQKQEFAKQIKPASEKSSFSNAEIIQVSQQSSEELSASLQLNQENIHAENTTALIAKSYFKNPVVNNKESLKEVVLAQKEKSKKSTFVKENLNKSKADIIEVVLAFFIPPLAVFLHNGIDMTFWVSLVLTCLFWIPGVVFSLLVVLDLI
jgi:uncharacterized membrane protein YqaE (UPF0057 family)